MIRLTHGLFVVLAWCWMSCDVTTGTSPAAAVYDRLRDDLLGRPEASRKRPPVVGSTRDSPFRLTFVVVLLDVIEVDQINQMMTVLAYTKIMWTNTELSWNATDYGNTEEILMESSSIWTPKISVFMGENDDLLLKLNDEVVVSSSGFVQSDLSSYVTFRCEIQFWKYPFDTQKCSFGLFYKRQIHNSSLELRMTNMTIRSKDYVTKGEWQIMNFSSSLFTDANLQTYPRYTVVVRRESVYYVITVVFPMVLTSVMIPMVFLIPTKTGEKISYLVTIFTSTAIFLSYINNVMPKNLSSLPCLAALLIEVLCEGLAAVLATLWVINMSDRADHNDGHLSTKIQVHPMVANTDPVTTKSSLKDGNFQEGVANRKVQDRRYVRRVDRCLFVLFASFQLVYLSVLFGATGWIE